MRAALQTPGRFTAEQIPTCSPWRAPCYSGWMPAGGCDPRRSPQWSRLLAGPADPSFDCVSKAVTHKAFVIFSLPGPAEEGRGRVALKGTRLPGRVNPPHHPKEKPLKAAYCAGLKVKFNLPYHSSISLSISLCVP